MSRKEEKPVHGVPGPPRRMMLTALMTGVGIAVAACGRLGGEEEPAPTGPPVVPDAASAMAGAEALLADARDALDAAFGDLGWQPDPEIGPRAESQDDGTCTLHPATLRSEHYLGHEIGSPEEIAEALNPVLREHGLPKVDPPTSGTGGWLTADAATGPLRFSFRSKGFTEISASNASQGPDCELPTS